MGWIDQEAHRAELRRNAAGFGKWCLGAFYLVLVFTLGLWIGDRSNGSSAFEQASAYCRGYAEGLVHTRKTEG